MAKYKKKRKRTKGVKWGRPRTHGKNFGEQAYKLIVANGMTIERYEPLKKKIKILVKNQTGVDALQYLGAARRYVITKHKMSTSHFEICLYLYPFNFFTAPDYTKIARGYYYSLLPDLIRAGLIKVMFKKEELPKGVTKHGRPKNIYTLTYTAKLAVTTFYRVLSGESKPRGFQNATYSDCEKKNKAIKNLIEEMMELAD